MATLPTVLINQPDSKSAGGGALRVRTQGLDLSFVIVGAEHLVVHALCCPGERTFNPAYLRRDIGLEKIVPVVAFQPPCLSQREFHEGQIARPRAHIPKYSLG